ncbi:hypothetical protein TNCV_1033601 [Trichonephila clavipes]|nr:hypothetical protein TNCV_1033601 [Trichonephila clavipes]
MSQSGGQSEARPQVLSRQASLVPIYRPTAVGMKGRVDLSQFRNKTRTCATRGLSATDHLILNHGQVTWTTPELAPPYPNYHTTPTGGRLSSRQI